MIVKIILNNFLGWDEIKYFVKKIIISRKFSYFYKVCYGILNLKILVGTFI